MYLFLILMQLIVFQAFTQEKHALLVIGQLNLSAHDEQVATAILTGKGYTVHALRPTSSAQVTAEISRLGAISQDPAQPGWNRFVFYFIGHGGGGYMCLNDLNDREKGTLLTDVVAKQIFEEIWVDAFTYIFDMCEAGLAVKHVWWGAEHSNQDPVGWILQACSKPTLGDKGATYGIYFSDAVQSCLGGMGQAVNADVLKDCLTRERWYNPWYYKSLPGVTKIDLVQPDLLAVF